MDIKKGFTAKDRIIVIGEGANSGRLATLLVFIHPGDTIFYEDGYWVAGIEGAWIIRAEDLVRKIRFRGEVISHLAQVTPDEVRELGRDATGYQVMQFANSNFSKKRA